MKHLFLCLALLATQYAFAQNDDGTPRKTTPVISKPAEKNAETLSPEQIQDRWKSYMSPGEMHELLSRDAGNWNETITMWTEPGAEPTQNTSTCEIKMIYDGRYQVAEHKGDFNGMTFFGTGTVAYDNVLKKFISTWIDNMGTGIMYTEGTYDAKKNCINFSGEMVDPILGKKVMVREVFYIVDEGTRRMEMFVLNPGKKEYKNMEITMRR